MRSSSAERASRTRSYRSRVAIGGYTGPNVAPLHLLDAASGATLLYRTPSDGRDVSCLRFCRQLLVAGTSKGQLALDDEWTATDLAAG